MGRSFLSRQFPDEVWEASRFVTYRGLCHFVGSMSVDSRPSLYGGYVPDGSSTPKTLCFLRKYIR
jgi:hypothetical protein